MKKQIDYRTSNLRARLIAHGIDPEKFDIEAHVDRKLSQRENYMNLTQMCGIGPRRTYGAERRDRATIQGEFYQIGRTHKVQDEKRKAKLPGKRRSASGKTYTERRKNRSDKPGWRI